MEQMIYATFTINDNIITKKFQSGIRIEIGKKALDKISNKIIKIIAKESINNLIVQYDDGKITQKLLKDISFEGFNHEIISVNKAKKYYENDLYWYKKLQSKWVSEFISANNKNQTISLKYYGDSLSNNNWKSIPNIEKQIVGMYKFFKKNNIFKINGSLSNLTHDNGQIKAFDFKDTIKRNKLNNKENMLNRFIYQNDLET